MSVTEHPWDAANQAFLRSELERLRARIEKRDEPPPAAAVEAMEYPPALHRLAELFALTPFERDLMLLCAGVELDARFAGVCRNAHGPSAPTFGLALDVLPEPHWSALAPTAPLRYWKLLDVLPGDGLLTSPLRVDERILHYVAGLSYPDERLHGLMQPRLEPADLPETHRLAAARVASLWGELDEHWGPVQLCGEDETGLQDVAAAACAERGLRLHVVRSGELPQAATDRELIARLWDREAVLGAQGLLLVVDESDTAETRRNAAAFVDRVQGALLIASREPLHLPDRTLPRVDVRKPGSDEQGELWRRLLGDRVSDLNGQIERLVNQFDMGRAAIETATSIVLRSGEGDTAAVLWETCRAQSRARLDDLSQRVETDATWDDLVLPELQLQILRDVVTHVRHRVTVYDAWGFRAAGGRGLGVSALFSGPSGTGKTLAAEILANELRLDLYRIDLSQVVSKYIGETEKNLHRVFAAAETAGAVLLFDEADALFGKRSEVKDSHDRYANIEVSYLLQRMEAYRGLAILTTNMKHALDPAFTRRIRFIAQFPFPEAGERAEIWRRIFPSATPTDDLDVELLARLNVAGGNIRNIALGAAFLAADDGGPVRMSHVLRAARAEYAKLDRPLTGSEIAGWPS